MGEQRNESVGEQVQRLIERLKRALAALGEPEPKPVPVPVRVRRPTPGQRGE